GAQAAMVADDDGSEVTVSGASFREAMKGIRPAALRDRYAQIAPVGWEDIGGLEEAKRTLREAVLWPLEYPEVYRQAGAAAVRGILLSGAPGTGMTLLAGALANEAGSKLIFGKGPALLSERGGESEKAVRDVSYIARLSQPCIIFIDELDALAPVRGGGNDSGVSERLVGQLLSEMDGLHRSGGVFVVAATNRPDL